MASNTIKVGYDITDVESKEMKDKTKYQPISKFPSSSADFTVVMKKELPAASVRAVATRW